MMDIESQIELYDSDLAKIRQIWQRLNAKYAYRKDSKENLLSLVHEAEDLFRQIGFEVTVAMSKKIAYAMGVAPTTDSPELITFSFDARVSPLEFDYDRMAWEQKHQLIEDDSAKRFLAKGGTQDQREKVDPIIESPEKE